MVAKEKIEADVAIVGAGLAGLVAARRVAAAGLRPQILEARDRVGGRLLNEPLDAVNVVELGGQWIGPTQDRIAALAAGLGVGTFPTYDDGAKLLEVAGGRASYRGRLDEVSLRLGRELVRGISAAGLLDFEQARLRLHRLARQVPTERPWEAPKARRRDAETFASWVHRNTFTVAARALWVMTTEAIWACEPADVSLLHVLFYVRSGGGLDRLLGTAGGAQQDRFRGGSQRLADLLAEELGDAVRQAVPVGRIEYGADSVRLFARRAEAGGEPLVLAARRAIVAIPPTLAGRIEYDPPLPAGRDQLTQRIPQGSVIKTMAVYETPFWRAAGLSGQAGTDVGPAKVTFDNSPPDGSPGVLLGFLEGRAAREWASRPAAERRAAVLAGHARLFGPAADRPQAYLEKVWADDPWARGCYGGLMTTGAWTEFGPALRAPIGPLHWAGAETATVWSGYMDGAVQSGERAADEAVAALD